MVHVQKDEVEMLDIIYSKAYAKTFLLVVSNKANYANEIKKVLDKKSHGPCVKQLKDLEEVGLIKAGKRTQSQKYYPDFDGIINMVISFFDLFFEDEDLFKNRKDLTNNKRIRDYPALEKKWDLLREDQYFHNLIKNYFIEYAHLMGDNITRNKNSFGDLCFNMWYYFLHGFALHYASHKKGRALLEFFEHLRKYEEADAPIELRALQNALQKFN